MICLYRKIPQNFMRLILLDRIWVLHIQFVRMVKFQFLAQFPMDHLTHPVLSRLILFLHKFTVFAFVIDYFVSVITYICYFVTSYLFLLKHSWFYGFVLLLIEIQFLSNGFLFSFVQVFSYDISLVCRLKYPIQLSFFPFSFPSYCCSLDPRAVCGFPGRYN